MKQDIIIISTNDWNGFWFQRQEFATRFAADGHRVFFVNRIPQRIPKPGRILRWLFARRQVSTIVNPVPEGVTVFRPLLLPPFGLLRPLNRLLWKRALRKLPVRPVDPLLITYQPTYNVLDLLPIVSASRIVYVNTHNYDADPSCPRDLLASERELVRRADVLLADAAWNVGRLEKRSPTVSVHRAMPGVSVERFAAAFRGDEAQRARTMYFFGDIGRHLDTDLYNALADRFEIVLVGIADASTAASLSPRITVRPPVSPLELPGVLREADILTIFYKSSPYVNGIIPAKFFECLAAGKPLFISGLPETLAFGDVVYAVDADPERAVSLAGRLTELETEERRTARREVALSADWSVRYRQFTERIGI
jgi:hypothetical protein